MGIKVIQGGINNKVDCITEMRNRELVDGRYCT